jgi:hypothetical protein
VKSGSIAAVGVRAHLTLLRRLRTWDGWPLAWSTETCLRADRSEALAFSFAFTRSL